MSYFERFPIINSYTIQRKTLAVQDITRRTGFTRTTKENPAAYIEHTIEDGETPIILADRMYDDSDLFWVIMIFNDMFDINNDWPLDNVSLERYVSRKYDGDLYGIHHYESLYSGAVVDEDHTEYDRVSITNMEYETRINEAKRYIKIPVPDYVGQIIANHNQLVQE